MPLEILPILYRSSFSLWTHARLWFQENMKRPYSSKRMLSYEGMYPERRHYLDPSHLLSKLYKV